MAKSNPESSAPPEPNDNPLRQAMAAVDAAGYPPAAPDVAALRADIEQAVGEALVAHIPARQPHTQALAGRLIAEYNTTNATLAAIEERAVEVRTDFERRLDQLQRERDARLKEIEEERRDAMRAFAGLTAALQAIEDKP